MQRKEQGFTLIELMVTIAILAIVSMIAAPNFKNAIDTRKIESTTTDFEKALAQSRSDAVLNRKKITIHLNSIGEDTPTDRYWNIPEDVNLSFYVGTCNGTTWSTSNIGALTTIEFLPKGNVVGLPTNLEIKVKGNGIEKFIYLTNFGRITSTKKTVFEGSCT